jgi:hypothetical protein
VTYHSDYPSEAIGVGNPYYACSHCGVSDPQINGRLEGHSKHCAYRLEKEAELPALITPKIVQAPKSLGQRPRLPRSAR